MAALRKTRSYYTRNSPGWDGMDGALIAASLMHKRMIWKPENLLNARREAERIGQLEAEIHKLYSLAGLIKITKKLFLKKAKTIIDSSFYNFYRFHHT